MLYLNLVSNELKKEIKLRHLYFLVRKISGIILIVTILLVSILLVAKIILQNSFNEIVSQTTLITKSNQTYNVKVREINDKLDFVSMIQTGYISWTNLFENLAVATPDGIKLYSLKLNSEDRTISIKGMAKNRVDLLNFKTNLENSPYCSAINFPLKNILEKENIDFEINTTLNLETTK